MLVCFSGKSAKQQQLFIISALKENETRVRFKTKIQPQSCS